MPARWVYYISGHGYGHAQRCAHVVREFARRWPDVEVDIRTTAAPFIFEGLGKRVSYEHVEIDRGVIEDSSIQLNWPKTFENLRDLIQDKDQIVRSEAAILRDTGAQMILADIPWLAGYVAQAAGIPCYAQGNFTWDWIYEPYLQQSADGRAMRDVISGGYQRMSGWLRLPFPHEHRHLKVLAELPLVDTPAILPPNIVLERLGISPDDTRQRIYFAMRGGISPETLAHAVAEDPSLLYLSSQPATGSLPTGAIAVPADLRFWDALSVCNLAISKLGHGIVTDTIAHRVRLLWPPRNGFREDLMLAAGAQPYCPNAELPLDDFLAGRWASHVHLLLQAPLPETRHPIAGAAFIADWVARHLGLFPL